MKQHLIAAGCLVFVLGSPILATAEEPKAPAASKSAAVKPLDWKTQQHRQKLFDEGQKLVDQEKWSEARDRFVEVDHLRSHPRVTLWLALCEERLGNLLKARTLYVQSQEQARDTKLADVEKDAGDALTALKPKVPIVALHMASGIQVEVMIDDAKATLQDDCVEVDPGKHTVIVRASGRKDYRAEFTVAAGEQKTLNVSLTEIPPPVAPPPPVPPSDRGSGSEGIPFIIAGGTLMAVGAPMLGVGASQDSAGWKGTGAGCLLLGAVGLAVGIPLAVMSSKSKQAEPAKSVSLSAAPLIGGAAFGVHGKF